MLLHSEGAALHLHANKAVGLIRYSSVHSLFLSLSLPLSRFLSLPPSLTHTQHALALSPTFLLSATMAQRCEHICPCRDLGMEINISGRCRYVPSADSSYSNDVDACASAHVSVALHPCVVRHEAGHALVNMQLRVCF